MMFSLVYNKNLLFSSNGSLIFTTKEQVKQSATTAQDDTKSYILVLKSLNNGDLEESAFALHFSIIIHQSLSTIINKSA